MKKEKIPLALRHGVWNAYVGEEYGTGHCLCCKTAQITRANFACGHILAEANGGHVTLENLRPVCTNCNSSMGKMNMQDFMEKYGFDKIPLRVPFNTDEVLERLSNLERKFEDLNARFDSLVDLVKETVCCKNNYKHEEVQTDESPKNFTASLVSGLCTSFVALGIGANIK